MTDGGLLVVYESAVTRTPAGSSQATVLGNLKEKSIAIDGNSQNALFRRKGKLCVQKLKGDSKKTNVTCTSSGNEEPYYPSSTGFWLIDRNTSRLIHLAPQGIEERPVDLKNLKPLNYSGISNTFAVRGEDKVYLFSFNDGRLEEGSTISGSCTTDQGSAFKDIGKPEFYGLTCHTKGKNVGEFDVVMVEITNGTEEARTKVDTIINRGHGALEHAWPNKVSSDAYGILSTYSDGQIVFSTERGKVIWELSSELGTAVDVIVAEYSPEDETEDIPKYESYGKNFIGAFIYRILTDIQGLSKFFFSLGPRLSSISFEEILYKIKGGSGTSMEDINYYNRYGLRKNLIFVTRSNKLISIDSLSGKDMWRVTLKPGQTIVKTMINAGNNIDLIYEENGTKKRTEINSLDGTFISHDIKLDQSAQTFLEGQETQAPVEIGFKNNFLKNSQQELTFYRVDKQQGIIGYRYTKDGKFEETWNYLLEAGQEILGYSYHLKGDDQYLTKAAKGALITIPEEVALYFKVVDSGNVALLIRQTVNDKSILVLTIINTLRGKVLGTYLNGDVDFSHPVKFIYDDNGIFVSYFNHKVSGFELWSIEIYKTKVETSFYEMLQKYVLKVKSDEELDYNREPSQFVILDKKYGLSVGLKYLGSIISIDRILVSARRASEDQLKKGKGKLSYYSSVYPPYHYFLPVTHMSTLNAKWRLSGIEKIKVVETKFESTSLVVAYGKDVFVTKIQPDNTFDLLNDDFNYTLLGLMSVAITIAVIVLRRLSVRSEAKKRYYAA